eukprot:TRINITY_DN8686_c0_g2_i3.p1 TRINITY_DN8686_c0_g2~~TRINITY_DN8686_c0_g2_i3.p1  ORF type:complete len:380 (-),score=19.13 TRINITY_DN8686_c0_g2_i3:207-1346(-)
MPRMELSRLNCYLQGIFAFTRGNDLPMPFKGTLLVFVNPMSGSGRALERWNASRVILEKSGYSFEVIRTERANHAKEYVNTLPIESLLSFTGIVTVSGDGLPHEVVNGIFTRPDAEVASTVPLGLLPGGSGNALLKSICHRCNESNDVPGASYILIKGRKDIRMDLIEITRASSPISIYAFLSMTWTYIADVDLESEFLRFLGGARFDVYGAWRVLFLRRYRAKFYYTEDESAVNSDLPNINSSVSLNPQWKFVDDNLIHLIIMNVKYISEAIQISPESDLNDGLATIQYMTGAEAGRFRLTKYLLTSNEGGHIVNGQTRPNSGLRYSKIKAFRLEPELGGRRRAGEFSIDGERYPVEKIQGKVLPTRLAIFCSKQLDY